MINFLTIGNTRETAPYHPLPGVDAQLRQIFEGAAQLTFTFDPADLRSLRCYDGVISYWDDWTHPVPEEAAAALEAYVAAGGGLLVIHNGISLQLQPSLEQLIGGRFLSHPAMRPLTFTPAAGHPITEGVSAFTLNEEPYSFALTKEARTPLLSYAMDGRDWPAGWCMEKGKGRVAFLCPGHTPQQFEDPEYRRLIRQAGLWVVG